MIVLRGKAFNEGIVIREFVALHDLTAHSKSGMPLTEEYRLFFCNKQLIGIYEYWEEGTYTNDRPNTKEFEAIAQHVDSHFFSMDIARKKDGSLIILNWAMGR